jgi:hypothetical protein
MSISPERLEKERRHLTEGPAPDEKPGGMGTVRFIARCPGNAGQVLDKAKAVLKAVNQHSTGAWPSDDQWREFLPEWFVSRCAPELTQEQAEAETARWRKLSREEQVRWEEERQWSVGNWVYWFEPTNRAWYWWDGVAIDDATLVIAVEVDNWPFPWGALAWLFRAAGANRVEAEE